MSTRHHCRTLKIGNDVVPIGKSFTDTVIRDRIVVTEVGERFCGEHNPKTKCVISLVLFIDPDLVGWVRLFH